MRPHQTEKVLHSKGNYQQNEKAAYGMGEDVCKWLGDALAVEWAPRMAVPCLCPWEAQGPLPSLSLTQPPPREALQDQLVEVPRLLSGHCFHLEPGRLCTSFRPGASIPLALCSPESQPHWPRHQTFWGLVSWCRTRAGEPRGAQTSVPGWTSAVWSPSVCCLPIPGWGSTKPHLARPVSLWFLLRVFSSRSSFLPVPTCCLWRCSGESWLCRLFGAPGRLGRGFPRHRPGHACYWLAVLIFMSLIMRVNRVLDIFIGIYVLAFVATYILSLNRESSVNILTNNNYVSMSVVYPQP